MKSIILLFALCFSLSALQAQEVVVDPATSAAIVSMLV